MEDLGQYIGIEFGDRGRGDKLDCWGLVMKLYKGLFDIELPSWDEYTSSCDIESASGILLNKVNENSQQDDPEWHQISPGNEQFGDIILMRVMGAPVHVGMVARDGKMIHVEKAIDSCMESYRGMRWKNRIVAFYRHRKQIRPTHL